MIQTLLTVAAGGAIGSSLRYLVNVGCHALLAPPFRGQR
jgi:fluoride ion exporter CrcB/FEX